MTFPDLNADCSIMRNLWVMSCWINVSLLRPEIRFKVHVLFLVFFFFFALGNTARVKAGGSVTIECSTAGCCTCASDFTGMFLYKDLERRDEVLYYHRPSNKSGSKLSPRKRFQNRVQTQGSFMKHNIIISNLSENDSGVYTCVYHKFPDKINAICNVHLLTVYGVC